MTSRDDATGSVAAAPDHAGSVLCRLLVFHPEVVDIKILGQTDMPGGVVSYSLSIILPGGRELYVDVEDAPATVREPARR